MWTNTELGSERCKWGLEARHWQVAPAQSGSKPAVSLQQLTGEMGGRGGAVRL